MIGVHKKFVRLSVRNSMFLFGITVWWLYGCFLPQSAPASRQEIEKILASYPRATDLKRIEGTDSMGNAVVRYTFTTTDAKIMVLDFYEQHLKPLGFSASNQAQYHNQDIDLWSGGCPVYDVGIVVDQSQHVLLEFTTSLCR